MDKLTPEIVKSILYSILDFVNDDMRASLLITHSTSEESNFIIKVATTNHVHMMNYNLGKEMKDVLQKIIEKKSSQALWKMKLEKNVILINKTRNITIVKSPYFQDETDQQVQSRQSVNDGSVKKKKPIKEKRMKSKLAKNESLENELNDNKSTEMLDAASTSESMNRNNRHKIVMKSEQITRLVEGLSAPIEGGKGLRMMQMMGWEGGALGVRGEGITEPILPNLNIIKGGNKKSKTDRTIENAGNPMISNVYTTVIEKLYHHFIKANKTETVIRMASSEKEKEYIKSFINCLNKRSHMSLKKYLRDIFAVIKTEMMKTENKDLVITVAFENNEIKLKSGTASHFPSSERYQEKAIGNAKPDSDTATSKEIKAKKWLDFKIDVLEKVAIFLDNDKNKEEVEINEVVSGKHSDFLDQVVGVVNKKHRVKVVDAIETGAWDLLLSKLKRNYLLDIVHQQSFQKIILRKEPIVIINKNVLSNVTNEITENGKNETHVKTSKIIKPEIVEVNLTEIKTVKYTDLPKPNLKIAKEKINEKSKTAKTVINKEPSKSDIAQGNICGEAKSNFTVKYTDLPKSNLKMAEKKIDKKSKTAKAVINEEPPKSDIAQGNICGEAKSDVSVKYTDSPQLEIAEANLKTKKTICVVYKTYPDDLIDVDTVVAFQYLINHVVSSLTEWLPRLECHGVRNGALIYTCYNDKTLYWFSHLIKDACNKVKIVSANNIFEEVPISKVSLKMNTFVNEKVVLILQRLEIYNKELDVSKWVVINKMFYDSYVVLTIEIDKISLDYISRNNFSLFCGHDKAKFSIIWD